MPKKSEGLAISKYHGKLVIIAIGCGKFYLKLGLLIKYKWLACRITT
jgi:hypothetical protein